ncbi:MAG: hypothetical protein ACK55I_33845, partial [bacterium]
AGHQAIFGPRRLRRVVLPERRPEEASGGVQASGRGAVRGEQSQGLRPSHWRVLRRDERRKRMVGLHRTEQPGRRTRTREVERLHGHAPEQEHRLRGTEIAAE